MDEELLAAAFRMEGAFNDLALRLAPGVRTASVVAEIDRLLVAYGGQGARERARQASHRMLESELRQLEAQATWIPMIFMLVAAFLVNVVLSRLVGTQREQIASLKAVGYSNRQIGVHFLEFAAVVVCAGSALGLVLGDLLGRVLTDAYLDFFRFPSRSARRCGCRRRKACGPLPRPSTASSSSIGWEWGRSSRSGPAWCCAISIAGRCAC
jgi:putative ABC transport system permease protein